MMTSVPESISLPSFTFSSNEDTGLNRRLDQLYTSSSVVSGDVTEKQLVNRSQSKPTREVGETLSTVAHQNVKHSFDIVSSASNIGRLEDEVFEELRSKSIPTSNRIQNEVPPNHPNGAKKHTDGNKTNISNRRGKIRSHDNDAPSEGTVRCIQRQDEVWDLEGVPMDTLCRGLLKDPVPSKSEMDELVSNNKQWEENVERDLEVSIDSEFRKLGNEEKKIPQSDASIPPHSTKKSPLTNLKKKLKKLKKTSGVEKEKDKDGKKKGKQSSVVDEADEATDRDISHPSYVVDSGTKGKRMKNNVNKDEIRDAGDVLETDLGYSEIQPVKVDRFLSKPNNDRNLKYFDEFTSQENRLFQFQPSNTSPDKMPLRDSNFVKGEIPNRTNQSPFSPPADEVERYKLRKCSKQERFSRSNSESSGGPLSPRSNTEASPGKNYTVALIEIDDAEKISPTNFGQLSLLREQRKSEEVFIDDAPGGEKMAENCMNKDQVSNESRSSKKRSWLQSARSVEIYVPRRSRSSSRTRRKSLSKEYDLLTVTTKTEETRTPPKQTVSNTDCVSPQFEADDGGELQDAEIVVSESVSETYELIQPHQTSEFSNTIQEFSGAKAKLDCEAITFHFGPPEVRECQESNDGVLRNDIEVGNAVKGMNKINEKLSLKEDQAAVEDRRSQPDNSLNGWSTKFMQKYDDSTPFDKDLKKFKHEIVSTEAEMTKIGNGNTEASELNHEIIGKRDTLVEMDSGKGDEKLKQKFCYSMFVTSCHFDDSEQQEEHHQKKLSSTNNMNLKTNSESGQSSGSHAGLCSDNNNAHLTEITNKPPNDREGETFGKIEAIKRRFCTALLVGAGHSFQDQLEQNQFVNSKKIDLSRSSDSQIIQRNPREEARKKTPYAKGVSSGQHDLKVDVKDGRKPITTDIPKVKVAEAMNSKILAASNREVLATDKPVKFGAVRFSETDSGVNVSPDVIPDEFSVADDATRILNASGVRSLNYSTESTKQKDGRGIKKQTRFNDSTLEMENSKTQMPINTNQRSSFKKDLNRPLNETVDVLIDKRYTQPVVTNYQGNSTTLERDSTNTDEIFATDGSTITSDEDQNESISLRSMGTVSSLINVFEVAASRDSVSPNGGQSLDEQYTRSPSANQYSSYIKKIFRGNSVVKQIGAEHSDTTKSRGYSQDSGFQDCLDESNQEFTSIQEMNRETVGGGQRFVMNAKIDVCSNKDPVSQRILHLNTAKDDAQSHNEVKPNLVSSLESPAFIPLQRTEKKEETGSIRVLKTSKASEKEATKYYTSEDYSVDEDCKEVASASLTKLKWQPLTCIEKQTSFAEFNIAVKTDDVVNKEQDQEASEDFVERETVTISQDEEYEVYDSYAKGVLTASIELPPKQDVDFKTEALVTEVNGDRKCHLQEVTEGHSLTESTKPQISPHQEELNDLTARESSFKTDVEFSNRTKTVIVDSLTEYNRQPHEINFLNIRLEEERKEIPYAKNVSSEQHDLKIDAEDGRMPITTDIPKAEVAVAMNSRIPAVPNEEALAAYKPVESGDVRFAEADLGVNISPDVISDEFSVADYTVTTIADYTVTTTVHPPSDPSSPLSGPKSVNFQINLEENKDAYVEASSNSGSEKGDYADACYGDDKISMGNLVNVEDRCQFKDATLVTEEIEGSSSDEYIDCSSSVHSKTDLLLESETLLESSRVSRIAAKECTNHDVVVDDDDGDAADDDDGRLQIFMATMEKSVPDTERSVVEMQADNYEENDDAVYAACSVSAAADDDSRLQISMAAAVNNVLDTERSVVEIQMDNYEENDDTDHVAYSVDDTNTETFWQTEIHSKTDLLLESEALLESSRVSGTTAKECTDNDVDDDGRLQLSLTTTVENDLDTERSVNELQMDNHEEIDVSDHVACSVSSAAAEDDDGRLQISMVTTVKNVHGTERSVNEVHVDNHEENDETIHATCPVSSAAAEDDDDDRLQISMTTTVKSDLNTERSVNEIQIDNHEENDDTDHVVCSVTSAAAAEEDDDRLQISVTTTVENVKSDLDTERSVNEMQMDNHEENYDTDQAACSVTSAAAEEDDNRLQVAMTTTVKNDLDTERSVNELQTDNHEEIDDNDRAAYSVDDTSTETFWQTEIVTEDHRLEESHMEVSNLECKYDSYVNKLDRLRQRISETKARLDTCVSPTNRNTSVAHGNTRYRSLQEEEWDVLSPDRRRPSDRNILDSRWNRNDIDDRSFTFNDFQDRDLYEFTSDSIGERGWRTYETEYQPEKYRYSREDNIGDGKDFHVIRQNVTGRFGNKEMTEKPRNSVFGTAGKSTNVRGEGRPRYADICESKEKSGKSLDIISNGAYSTAKEDKLDDVMVTYEYGEMYSVFREVPFSIEKLRENVLYNFNNSPTVKRLLQRFPSLRPSTWKWQSVAKDRQDETAAEESREVREIDHLETVTVANIFEPSMATDKFYVI